MGDDVPVAGELSLDRKAVEFDPASAINCKQRRADTRRRAEGRAVPDEFQPFTVAQME
jgi:hypothetical protein